jgi:hypothetical protein
MQQTKMIISLRVKEGQRPMAKTLYFQLGIA